MTVALLIPGAAGSSAFWDPVARRLPASWRVQALDLPGLGFVPPRPDIASYDDLVELAARAMPGPGAVIAQSMGAYIALQLAIRHPRLVTRLSLIAATGGVSAAAHGAEEWRRDYAETFPNAAAWARAPVLDLTDAELEAITIPVLLLWATDDPLSPLAIAHRLAGRMRNSRLVTFPSHDHRFIHQFANETADELRRFVAEE